MPNWAIHLIVPLLALLIAGRKENYRYILLMLPLAVIPDLDTFVTQHRALLHNMFIPIVLLLFGVLVNRSANSGNHTAFLKEKSMLFIIAGVYIASHVFLDLFDGGAVLFYPFYNEMAFVEASVRMTPTNELIWVFDFGFNEYGSGWKNAYGYITDSIGTGAMAFVLLAGVCLLYRNRKGER